MNNITELFNKNINSQESLKSLIKEHGSLLEWQELLKIQLEQIYWPSKYSAAILIIFSISFIVISHIPLDIFPSVKWINSENLVAIVAGISALIFALLIFVAQQFNKNHKEARVLLKESKLYPIVVLTIFCFFNFILNGSNAIIAIFIIFIGILTINSLYSLFKILLSKNKFFNENIKLVTDLFERSIELAIDERLGNNILLEKIEDFEIEYNPLIIKNKHQYHDFYSYKEGIIQDINLTKLRYFSEEVERESKQNGYSYYDNEPVINSENDNLDKNSIKEPKRYKQNNNRFLLKGYKSAVNDDDVLICVEKSIIKDEKILESLKKRINDIFIIKSEDENFSEEIKLELNDWKEQFISAIKNENLSKIDEAYKIYPKLEETFINLLNKYGSNYNFEQAQKERNALFGGWNEVRWLSEDIRYIFNTAMDSDNQEIIRKVGYLPILIANKALDLNDHYFFQEFISFVIPLYMNSKQKPDDLKSFMIDRSWRYLKETSQIVEMKLEELDKKENELISLKNFAIYIYIIFQYLLEKSIKVNDLKTFKTFNSVFNKLFTHFDPLNDYMDLEDVEWELQWIKDYGGDPDEKINLEMQLKNKKELENIITELNERKNQMIFGLATWIFGKYQQQNYLKEFYLEIINSLPENFLDFTEVFLSAHTLEADDFWNWDRWESYPEGEVIVIDTMGKLEKFYLIRSLQLLNNKKLKKSDLKFSNEKYNHDMYLLAKNNRFIKFLDNIPKNRDKWKSILISDEINQIKNFKEILNEYVTIWEEIEKRKMREGKLDQNKIDKFRKDVLKRFNEVIILRNIFEHFNLYENKIKEVSQNNIKIGLIQMDDKSVFFDDWYVNYPNSGIRYGNNLARGEESSILENILNNCKKIEKKMFKKTLEKISSSDIIIIVTGFNSSEFIMKSKNFFGKYDNKVPKLDLNKMKGFKGYHKSNENNIPVFRVFNAQNDSLIILNKSKFGKLTQYYPLNKLEDQKFMRSMFYMNIRAFSDDKSLMKEYLTASIDWLKDIGNDEEQRKYLEEKVLIEIYEKFEFVKEEGFEGYFIDFSKDN
ncbi:MAG: hypothetical protein Q7V10_05010 [Methanobacteriaceae archaeon]|nr:hypothetical protein [Methanobacteriaceae archaeon]